MAVTNLSAPLTARIRADHLELRSGSGAVRRLHHIWLRDNCPCDQCVHPGSRQRVVDTALIPAQIRPLAAHVDDGVVALQWPDEHRSLYPLERLWQRPSGARPRFRLWGAADPLPDPFDGERMLIDDSELERVLAAVDTYGIAVMNGLGRTQGRLEQVVARFGHIRETNYGRIFDVRTVTDPTNLAYTGLALPPHTDNPYREPPPGLQLLHCIHADSAGGDTIVVDGFAVAEDLRRQHPSAFSLLRRTPIAFAYHDAVTTLETRAPVIAVDAEGTVEAIRYNTRSTRPFEFNVDLTNRYYHAYQRFGRLCGSARMAHRFRLSPGDVVIMNNHRILHGRTAIKSAGGRHLQGCYSERDGLTSTLRTLCRPKERP